MNKIAQEQIASHYYSIGCELALRGGLEKTAGRADKILEYLKQTVGRGTAHTLPVIGAGTGAGVGGALGGVGGAHALSSLFDPRQDAAYHMLAGVLGGTFGAGVGAGVGGYGGARLGSSARDKILKALNRG